MKEQELDEFFSTEGFTVLENKTIGKNLYRLRKIRDKKALEVARHIGIGEPAYTKYERGESKITIELIQKIAEFYKVDPLQLLSAASSSHFVENVQNSPFAIHGIVRTTDEEQTKTMIKLLESVLLLNEKVVSLLDAKGKTGQRKK